MEFKLVIKCFIIVIDILFALVFLLCDHTNFKSISAVGVLLVFITIAVGLEGNDYKANSVKTKNTVFPNFVFFFKEFNCDPRTIKDKIFKELSEETNNKLKERPTVSYLEVYDNYNPFQDKKHSQLTFAGFALTQQAKNDEEIHKILETLEYKKREIKMSEVELKSILTSDGSSKRLALEKMLTEVWEYVEKVKKCVGIAFMWEGKKSVACGAFVGQEVEQFKLGAIDKTSIADRETIDPEQKESN